MYIEVFLYRKELFNGDLSKSHGSHVLLCRGEFLAYEAKRNRYKAYNRYIVSAYLIISYF
ncbi:hypothetical protein J19TS1_06950 [Heyndrickxia oleronia]|nr:hypothetical protein J19TS1_06950 [Heyndrickxia oleronia]